MISWSLLVPALVSLLVSLLVSSLCSPNSSRAEWGSQFLLETVFVPSWFSGSSCSGACLPSCLLSFFLSLLFAQKRSLFHHDFLVPSGSGACLPSCLSSCLFFFLLKWFCRRSARPADIRSAKAAEATEFTIIRIPTVTWKHGFLLFGVYAGVISNTCCATELNLVIWWQTISSSANFQSCFSWNYLKLQNEESQMEAAFLALPYLVLVVVFLLQLLCRKTSRKRPRPTEVLYVSRHAVVACSAKEV